VSQRRQALEAHLKKRAAQWQEAQPLTGARLRALWKDLDSDDRATGYAAMQALLAAPQSTVAWFRTHLKEPPAGAAPDPRGGAALMREGGRRACRGRGRAREELKQLGRGVVPPLRQAVKDAPDVETARRIQAVLSLYSPNDSRAREVRAVQV